MQPSPGSAIAGRPDVRSPRCRPSVSLVEWRYPAGTGRIATGAIGMAWPRCPWAVALVVGLAGNETATDWREDGIPPPEERS